jgi:hypothetical protein
MSDLCPRCGTMVRLTDPHQDCPGPKWENYAEVPGFDRTKLTVSGLKPEIDRLRVLVRVALTREAIASLKDAEWNLEDDERKF